MIKKSRIERAGRGRAAGWAAVAGLALALTGALPAAGASELFKQPSIGLDPPKIIRTVPPATAPALGANQCQLAAGTCPLGRLQRSGTRCYCASPGGGARQGTTRTRPQDARPPIGE